jgi:hypothetical protein
MSEKRWMKTEYTLTIYQNEDAGNSAIPDQPEIMGMLDEVFDDETPAGFQSFHVEQGNTVTQPTDAEEEMRRRVYRALNDHGPNGWGPLLHSFAESILHEVDDREDIDEDSAHEIANGAVPVYTIKLIELFTESAELACWEPELEVGPDADTSTVASYVLYDLAMAITNGAIAEKQEDDDEKDE